MKTDKRPHSAGAYILLEGNRPHTTYVVRYTVCLKFVGATGNNQVEGRVETMSQGNSFTSMAKEAS